MPKKDENKNVETPVTETTETQATETKATEETAPTNKTTITCPHCKKEIAFEAPAVQRRGQLAGISVEDMTDEQLKRELVNAKSVLYKAEKRGASAETILANKARVEAAEAVRDARKAAKVAEATPEVTPESDAKAKEVETAEV